MYIYRHTRDQLVKKCPKGTFTMHQKVKPPILSRKVKSETQSNFYVLEHSFFNLRKL